MKNAFKKILMTALLFAAGGALAHDGSAIVDAGGNNPSATDLAAVTCFDDGNGAPAYLFGQIRDNSQPAPGLLLNFQIYKGNQMTSITDTVSGDGSYSQGIALSGGPGVYYISASKTKAGLRAFDVTWHCLTSGNIHTGTELTVLQFQ
ncbi:conserved exported hypothetical protein [Candidatus Methylobacter favarea]|uniref:Carboxypeptidase regulatory-like domain-containing protein n=1 Tax=Candidatus Methylobacter favarea TaxID=2707345 RepID=A0A8S0X763_9GAMM|nr:hypothetical protein [Candidatus Methylobacter favarea]CAA9889805.1 conserved exported hypothetical protein [Candidatus Methylobacter favarea]